MLILSSWINEVIDVDQIEQETISSREKRIIRGN